MRADRTTSDPGNAKAALRPSSLLSLVDAAEAWSGREPGPCVGDDGPAPDTAPGISSLPLNLLDIAVSWTGGGMGPCVGDDGPIVDQDQPGRRHESAPGHERTSSAAAWMSVKPPKAEVARGRWHFRSEDAGYRLCGRAM